MEPRRGYSPAGRAVAPIGAVFLSAYVAAFGLLPPASAPPPYIGASGLTRSVLGLQAAGAAGIGRPKPALSPLVAACSPKTSRSRSQKSGGAWRPAATPSECQNGQIDNLAALGCLSALSGTPPPRRAPLSLRRRLRLASSRFRCPSAPPPYIGASGLTRSVLGLQAAGAAGIGRPKPALSPLVAACSPKTSRSRSQKSGGAWRPAATPSECQNGQIDNLAALGCLSALSGTPPPRRAPLSLRRRLRLASSRFRSPSFNHPLPILSASHHWHTQNPTRPVCLVKLLGARRATLRRHSATLSKQTRRSPYGRRDRLC